MSIAQQQATVKSNSTSTDKTPLDKLSALLSADMLKVNEKILLNMESGVSLIPQIASYLIAAGGKRIRPLLTLACTRLYGDTGERPFNLAASVEFIHTATLLHDDVVDGSDQRRGKKAANLVFGNQASVLVGDFLFSRAFQLMVEDGSIKVLKILSDASAIIAQGEVKQLTTANNLTTTMEDYIEVVSAKTAALFAAACEIGPVIADAGELQENAMREYGMCLGIAFQIVDDVLDYSATQQKLGKSIGDDFQEGKMTAPVIIALACADAQDKEFLIRTIEHKDQKDGDLEQMQQILLKYNALEQGMNMAKSYAEKAKDALKDTPQCELRELLADLITFTIEREY